jgi:hypothetical protein
MSDAERGIRLDIARVKGQMNNEHLSPERREVLFRALKELYWKLRKV